MAKPKKWYVKTPPMSHQNPVIITDISCELRHRRWPWTRSIITSREPTIPPMEFDSKPAMTSDRV